MFEANEDYLKLPGSYLFSTVAKKAAAYQKAKENGKYATTLCQMATYLKYRGASGDAEREAECYEKAFPAVEKGTPEYLSVAAMMITAYNNQGKADKASKLAKQLQPRPRKQGSQKLFSIAVDSFIRAA